MCVGYSVHSLTGEKTHKIHNDITNHLNHWMKKWEMLCSFNSKVTAIFKIQWCFHWKCACNASFSLEFFSECVENFISFEMVGHTDAGRQTHVISGKWLRSLRLYFSSFITISICMRVWGNVNATTNHGESNWFFSRILNKKWMVYCRKRLLVSRLTAKCQKNGLNWMHTHAKTKSSI